MCDIPNDGDYFRKEFDMVFAALDLERDLEDQGPFDVLLLKWNQQLAKVGRLPFLDL